MTVDVSNLADTIVKAGARSSRNTADENLGKMNNLQLLFRGMAPQPCTQGRPGVPTELVESSFAGVAPEQRTQVEGMQDGADVGQQQGAGGVESTSFFRSRGESLCGHPACIDQDSVGCWVVGGSEPQAVIEKDLPMLTPSEMEKYNPQVKRSMS